MVGRPPLLISKKFYCAWNQIRLHTARARSSRRSPLAIGRHASSGWFSLASFLSLVTLGCSWSQLNLDATQESFPHTSRRDNSRERRRHEGDDDSNEYVRLPLTYKQTSEQTVFPGDHTGVARYDTAQLDSTPNRVTDFAAAVLPIPSGYWSIFALISETHSKFPGPVTTGTHGAALSWMRRNIVPAVAGSLADAHNDANNHLSPPKTRIDEALKQALDLLDGDARAAPWTTRHATQATSQPLSTLLAFFDSESRMLHIANAGAGRAFLGRRVIGGGSHECQELTGSDGARYFINPDTHSRAKDVDHIDGGGSAFPSRGELDVASVHVKSIEVRDGDFLVLGSHDTWTRLDGDEAVQAVSGWMREQQEMASTQEQPALGGRRRAAQDRSLDFPWRDNQGLGIDWVHTMIPDLVRDVDKMFVGVRHGKNAATRVLRPGFKHAGADKIRYDEDFHAAVRSRSTSDSE